MIVRPVHDGLQLITQPDHAHLARTIMVHCVPLAALVAQHALTVYDRFRSDAGWTPFFDEIAVARGAMLRASGMPLDDLEADYPFVRLADLISLTFCAGWADKQRFGDWTVQLFGTRVVVSPDPFGGVVIPTEINAREIRHRQFRSDAELWDALSEGSTTTLRGEVSGRRS